MKSMKPLAALLALTLVLAAGTAVAQTVTAIPTTIDPLRLAHREYLAGITGYNAADRTMTVTLYDEETFSAEALRSLKPGDTVVSNGEEYAVKTVTFADDNGDCVINQGNEEYAEGSLTLETNGYSGGYIPIDEYDMTNWISAAEITIQASDALVFLDDVDPENGEILAMPKAYNVVEFVKLLDDYLTLDKGIGFDSYNLYILFNERNEPVVIRRFYTEWQ